MSDVSTFAERTTPYEQRVVDELAALFAAGRPCVVIETVEESSALAVVHTAARRVIEAAGTLQGAEVLRWSVLDGALRDGADPHPGTENAAGGLYWMAQRPGPAVQVALDVGPHLGEPRTLRAWRALVDRNERHGGCCVMIEHAESPDAGARALVAAVATRYELPLPREEEIEPLVRSVLRGAHAERAIEIDLTRGEYAAIVRNLVGLSARSIRRVVSELVREDRRLDAADVPRVLGEKRRELAAGAVLEHVESPASLDEVGGLGRLKEWLARRGSAFEPRAREFGIVPPRGVLLLGVQGSGKSLSARAIATAWQRPLVRLDPGRLYDRYVGESEKRLREALRSAEAMAPIVLWIDEIEKGFASAAAQSTDGGLSQRMFGTFLTWMQDHRAPVFLVATANNVHALPPELLRKGRFDEIFFVDLPGEEARRAIWTVHLSKRGRTPGAFDLEALVRDSAGFSGAEIEQAVASGLHAAFAAQRDVTTADLMEAVRTSPPLSVTMREQVQDLRAWAAGRCVPAE
jgi:SpoVK/Ycf46/Vps4 family AAA+-type ATPase